MYTKDSVSLWNTICGHKPEWLDCDCHQEEQYEYNQQ